MCKHIKASDTPSPFICLLSRISRAATGQITDSSVICSTVILGSELLCKVCSSPFFSSAWERSIVLAIVRTPRSPQCFLNSYIKWQNVITDNLTVEWIKLCNKKAHNSSKYPFNLPEFYSHIVKTCFIKSVFCTLKKSECFSLLHTIQ